jgi:integrase
MASIAPYSNGFRASVCVKGTRDTKTFRTKREALAWSAARETELLEIASKPKGDVFTLGDCLRRYQREISPLKRGNRWESVRIDLILRGSLPVDKPISFCTANELGLWRDARLKTVSANSVRREFAILSNMFEVARREWGYIKENPVRDVRKPRSPDHREIVISLQQIKLMLKAFGYSPVKPIRTISQACAMAFLIALRTGMRAGEITKLTWANVHDGYCVLPVTKTVPRNVPLDLKAERVIKRMIGFDDLLVFGLTAATLDARFRTIRTRAGLDGFTFHDSRHTAATRLAKKLHVLDLCKMFGWADPKQAMTYYNPKVTEITAKLNARQLPDQSQ